MQAQTAQDAFRAMGLVYVNSRECTSGAAFGRFVQQCKRCELWQGVGALVVLRYRRKAQQPPRAYCVECAVKEGFARWIPSKDPTAPFVPPAWDGRGFKPVTIAKYGTKWGEAS